jgi:hypothetical protein
MRGIVRLCAATALLAAVAGTEARAGGWMVLNSAPPPNTSGVFTGTVDGVAFTATATNFVGSPYTDTTGSATFFSGLPGTFTPLLPTSYALGYYSQFGFAINFASPVTNVKFDIFSLVNTLDFGTPVTLVSAGGNNSPGGPGVGITVSGTQVIGQAAGNGGDANGTIALPGTFTTIMATPLTGASDGSVLTFYAQAVPEPSSLTLAGLGVAFGGVAWRLRRRSR